MLTQREQVDIVRRHFDTASGEWASRYERAPHRMSDLDLQLRRDTALEFLGDAFHELGTPLEVLDVGCGPGDLFDGLSRGELHVHGVDVSPEMIARAASRHPEDTYSVADAAELPFDPASLDVVTCLGVLEYVPDPGRALAEFQRVLRPGGHFIVSFPNRSSIFRRLSAIEIRVERALLRAVQRLRGRAELVEAPQYAHRQWSPTEAADMLTASGFALRGGRFNTFGLYGQLGRMGISLALSRWMSARCGGRRILGRLGQTWVVSAVRAATS